MAETHGFIKILPDSTGKRIPQSVMVELKYDNGVTQFLRGDIVTGVTSGISGTILKVDGTTIAGELHILVAEPIPTNLEFLIGESLDVNGSTCAKAASTGYPFYFQQTNIAGGKNLTNLVDVDQHGALYTRFSEGSPQFDAFGKMQVSQQHLVAEYLNQYGIDYDKLSVILSGGGAIAHIPESSGVLMSVGTAAGDKCEMVSNQYHSYRPGQSRLIEFTTAAGDIGKDNLLRVWGYGDDDDGVFFYNRTVLGVPEFGAMIRSSVTGSVTETYIPQSQWNKDRIDGSRSLFNPSEGSFDITKDNITWIDFQWLGAGTVRFGVVIDGIRIICHEQHHSNKFAHPYMRTGSLPVYYEIKNLGPTPSSSEFRVWCSVVKNEGDFDAPSKDFAHTPDLSVVSDTFPHIITSFRAKQQINGITNRKSSYLSSMTALSVSAPIIIEIWKNAPLTGATFSEQNGIDSGLEYDTTATAIDTVGARKLFATVVDQSGVQTVDLTRVFNSRDEGIRRHFDPTTYDTYTITARRVQGTGNTTVYCTLNVDDV